MAYDECHPQIVRALVKAGWEITNQSYFIALEEFSAVPDIRARKINGAADHIIIVEVKCFTDERTEQDELYRAVGQYIFYRIVLEMKPEHGKLYMAIPLKVYDRLFVSEIVTAMVNEARVNLIVIDTDSEEVVRWLG